MKSKILCLLFLFIFVSFTKGGERVDYVGFGKFNSPQVLLQELHWPDTIIVIAKGVSDDESDFLELERTIKSMGEGDVALVEEGRRLELKIPTENLKIEAAIEIFIRLRAQGMSYLFSINVMKSIVSVRNVGDAKLFDLTEAPSQVDSIWAFLLRDYGIDVPKESAEFLKLAGDEVKAVIDGDVACVVCFEDKKIDKLLVVDSQLIVNIQLVLMCAELHLDYDHMLTKGIEGRIKQLYPLLEVPQKRFNSMNFGDKMFMLLE